jgi:uncharacterized Zn finger protein
MRQVITLELDLSTLRQAIGAGSYVRGAEYARQQAVLQTTWDAADTALRGLVRGQGGNVYQTAAFFSLAGGRRAEFEMGECSCPVEFNCKHVVALVLSVLEPGSPKSARPERRPVDRVLRHRLTPAVAAAGRGRDGRPAAGVSGQARCAGRIRGS